MRRLPDFMVLVEQLDDDHLAVAAHENLGAYYWTKFALADLPEHLASTEDAISFVLHTIDLRSISQAKQDGAFHSGQLPIDGTLNSDPLKFDNGDCATVVS